VEPNIGYADYSIREYGLDVKTGFIQEAALPSESFDAVTAWHVLEHTEDPSGVLRRLYECLKPRGILVVEVPNVEAVCQSPSSTFHKAHIYNFNGITLRGIVEKTGFSLVSLSLSPDGGNITVIARKQAGNGAPDYAGNALNIINIVKARKAIPYYLSFRPYSRLAGRLIRMVQEWYGLRRELGGREILDKVYAGGHRSRQI
jgi:SAM-dependent methyltransferase